MINSSERNPAITDSLIKKLSYNSKKSTFTWRSSFVELKIFCFELLEIDSTTCSKTQNEQRKSIKGKSLTVNYYKTGTLQLQGNNVQSAKDKFRAAMDGAVKPIVTWTMKAKMLSATAMLLLACEAQTHFRSSLLSLRASERSDDRKCVCASQAMLLWTTTNHKWSLLNSQRHPATKRTTLLNLSPLTLLT